MYAFEYHRPHTLTGAIADLEKQDAKALAGGMTILPTMKQRLAAPSALVELKDVPELKGLSRDGDNLVVGAMTRHAEVASSPVVKSAIPALATLAAGIGDAHVRNRGTIGGSLANNDPAADYPAAALALGATIVTSKRRIAAQDFFKGLFETALEPGELITQVSFPVPQKAAYMKFANPALRYALVGVFVAKTAGGVRVAVTGAGESGVLRSQPLGAALNANFSAAAADGVSVPASGLNTDIHADADYRAHLIKVMAKRAVAAAG
ncbi:MAG: FAD binding domain-containing protein [Hyphomicrobiales bacterium]|nr:FAD binding domain-containing protein [Hyphomicrobiales bacterium]